MLEGPVTRAFLLFHPFQSTHAFDGGQSGQASATTFPPGDGLQAISMNLRSVRPDGPKRWAVRDVLCVHAYSNTYLSYTAWHSMFCRPTSSQVLVVNFSSIQNIHVPPALAL